MLALRLKNIRALEYDHVEFVAINTLTDKPVCLTIPIDGHNLSLKWVHRLAVWLLRKLQILGKARRPTPPTVSTVIEVTSVEARLFDDATSEITVIDIEDSPIEKRMSL